MQPITRIKRTWQLLGAFFIVMVMTSTNCQDKPVQNPGQQLLHVNEIDIYLTTADRSSLIQKQSTISYFDSSSNGLPDLIVDSTVKYQSIDGFGYTLTGSSAFLINRMNVSARAALLDELFNGGISYLRISLGASDLNPAVYSYDDMPSGQTDPTLSNFSLGQDTVDLIPVLKEILQINPNLKILASPWSPPVWMKDNGSTIGGGLLPQYYQVYANYFVRYVQAMGSKGIPVHAVTVQNEPQHGGNNPSMVMSALEQLNFIKANLGPSFLAASLTTRIVCWDHNCDNPNYPITVLNDAVARTFVDGSAFHLYGGDISALTTVKNAHPDKNLYFTEQWTSAAGSFEGDLKWHIKNVIIGSMRNWSRVALEWNLANDPSYTLHTPGGCDACKGAITVNGSAISRNVSYYIIMQIARFVPSGSIRISSSSNGSLSNVAFEIPGGKKAMIVLNENSSGTSFNIMYRNKRAVQYLPAGAVATYTW